LFSFAFSDLSKVAATFGILEDGVPIGTMTALPKGTSPTAIGIPSAVYKSSPDSVSWVGRATNTAPIPTTFDSTAFTVNWYFKVYSGTSASVSLNEAGIEGLVTGTLKSGFVGTYTLTTGDYKYICFPDSFGSPTAVTGFKDSSTGLAVSMADVGDDAFYSNTQNGWSYGLVSVTNGTAHPVVENYRVYRTKNILGGAIDIIVS